VLPLIGRRGGQVHSRRLLHGPVHLDRGAQNVGGLNLCYHVYRLNLHLFSLQNSGLSFNIT
jgi:hypothetical protein